MLGMMKSVPSLEGAESSSSAPDVAHDVLGSRADDDLQYLHIPRQAQTRSTCLEDALLGALCLCFYVSHSHFRVVTLFGLI